MSGAAAGDGELLTLRSPVEMASQSPALLSVEALTWSTFALLAWHASGAGRAHHLLLFITLTAASAVDPYCLISDDMRNYWHGHASVLAASRRVAPWQFPLFAILSYMGAARAWRLGLGLVPEALAAALISTFTYYPCDMICCKYSVYQWHDTDPLFAARSGECVPCGSSFWVMSYAGVASILARVGTRAAERNFCGTAAGLTLLHLVVHILPFQLWYLPLDLLGILRPCESTVAACAVCAAVTAAAVYLRRGAGRAGGGAGGAAQLDAAAAWWVAGLAAIVLVLDPADVVSTSRHQPFGAGALCGEEETYMYGLLTRPRYICEAAMRFWRLCGESRPEPKDEWYTTCGLPASREWSTQWWSNIAAAVALHVAAARLSPAADGKRKSR